MMNERVRYVTDISKDNPDKRIRFWGWLSDEQALFRLWMLKLPFRCFLTVAVGRYHIPENRSQFVICKKYSFQIFVRIGFKSIAVGGWRE